MIRVVGTALAVLVVTTCAFSIPITSPAPPAGITLIGQGLVSGLALDKSGLTGNICQTGAPANCVPKSIFGGFGSDITYTGHDNVFIAAPDRGPFDGLTDVAYVDRFHFLHITTDIGAPFPNIRTTLLDTRFFRNETNQLFLGAAGAFVLNDTFATLRFDPQGIRVAPDGTFYVSDEYGPYVFQFNRQGHLIRRISVPSRFAILNLNARSQFGTAQQHGRTPGKPRHGRISNQSGWDDSIRDHAKRADSGPWARTGNDRPSRSQQPYLEGQSPDRRNP